MLTALLVVPFVAAALAWAVPSDRARAWIVPLGGAVHAALTFGSIARPPTMAHGAWIGLDPLNKLVLGQVSLLFLACALYAPAYLALRPNRKSRVFCAGLLAFLGGMTLAALARHLGLMWVGIEASTLAAAPLLYFNHNQRSIEATWKYLLIGSVGIAIALLGSFFLAYASLYAGLESTLLFDDLLRDAPALSDPWLHAAIVLLFVGYGTKMGLAPMHTWKPDAYGEAPGVVGALLAGGLTATAFMAVVRFFQIALRAGEGEFARQMLVVGGLLSMAVAGVFMVRQTDYKRMLAYSSVEHMGILVLGIGIGGGATFGALLHMLANGFTKGVLFLAAGNIHRAYGSKRADEVQGALRRTPLSGALLLAGFFAITGAPPFAPFLSEFTILDAAIGSGQVVPAALFLGLLVLVFIGMGTTVLSILQGEPGPRATATRFEDGVATTASPLVLLCVVFLLGVYIPRPVLDLLNEAAAYVEAQP